MVPYLLRRSLFVTFDFVCFHFCFWSRIPIGISSFIHMFSSSLSFAKPDSHTFICGCTPYCCSIVCLTIGDPHQCILGACIHPGDARLSNNVCCIVISSLSPHLQAELCTPFYKYGVSSDCGWVRCLARSCGRCIVTSALITSTCTCMNYQLRKVNVMIDGKI